MAQFEVVDKKSSRVADDGQSPTGPITQPVNMVPGISYIPDKIEIAEDQVLLAKISHEMLDFIKILSQLLDVMWIIKPKHLRSVHPLPPIIIEELLLNQGKGPRLKALEAKLIESIPVASPSVELVLKTQSHQPIITSRRDMNNLKNDQSAHPNKGFPFAHDLVDITGKKTRTLWHGVMLEKPEELSILKPKPPRKESFTFKTKAITYQQCRINEELERYNNFLNDVIKVGLFNCREMVHVFELLAKHFHMNYNSLPLAKARLCLIVMSLPFWDISRIETQRAVEFILEKILLLPEKPLVDWLRVRGIPYVVSPPYSAENFLSRPNSESTEVPADEEKEKAIIISESKSMTVENSMSVTPMADTS